MHSDADTDYTDTGLDVGHDDEKDDEAANARQPSPAPSPTAGPDPSSHIHRTQHGAINTSDWDWSTGLGRRLYAHGFAVHVDGSAGAQRIYFRDDLLCGVGR